MAELVDNGQVVAQVELPAEVLNIQPSDIGGWSPKGPIAKGKPVVTEVIARSKRATPDKPDFMVRFTVGGVSVRSYISTILGTWDNTFPGEKGKLFDQGTTGLVFKQDLMIGYEKVDNNPQFPIQMVAGKKGI